MIAAQQQCPHCRAPNEFGAGALHRACVGCHELIFLRGGGWHVVVGHQVTALAEQIGDILVGGGFDVVAATTGRQVMDSAPRAQAIVIDVALEDDSAFFVLDHIRGQPQLRHIRAILVASVYNKTAYKRRPSQLYGADDYIEQHHLGDSLVPKLLTLLGPQPVRPPSAPKHIELAQQVRLRALARSIIADIALYHQADFETAVTAQTPPALVTALDEGRRLFSEMAQGDHGLDDPIGTAFTAFVDELRRVST